MNRTSEVDERKKREKIQIHFWNIVNCDEHISLPMLKDAVEKEFNYREDRLVQAQIKLMQTEARIRIQSRVKVWIEKPQDNHM